MRKSAVSENVHKKNNNNKKKKQQKTNKQTKPKPPISSWLCKLRTQDSIWYKKTTMKKFQIPY